MLNRTMLAAMLNSFIQHVLTKLITALVTVGVWKETDASVYQTALAAFLTQFLLDWIVSAWKRYGSNIKWLTALALPAGTTESNLNAAIADGTKADPTTPPTKAPTLLG
jgi:hypothetical protein